MSDPVPPRPDVGSAAGPFGGWRRLHPAAIAVWTSGSLVNLALPVVVLLLFGADQGPLGFLAVITGVAVVGPAVRWSRFWYRVSGDALVMRGGLLQRWERTIQRSRIQSVDVVQKLTHRAFGVVELRIEVVGGQGTEGSLVAVTPREADLLRGLLVADRPAQTDRPEPPLVRMRSRDLLLAGVTGGRVAVLAGLVGWATQVLPEDTFVRTLDRLAGADRSDIETAVVVVATFLLASVAISLASTILVYWGFTAERHGDRLVISRGLLQTRRTVVPLRRIQSLRVEENLVRRPLGLAALRVVTAGYGKRSGDEQQTSTLIPVARRERCAEIAATVLGWNGLPSVTLHPAPPRSLWLRLMEATIVSGLAGLVAWMVLSDARWLAVAAPIAAAAFVLAFLSWRALGHAVTEQHVVARWGGLLQRTAIANIGNVQHLVFRRSPVQRLLGIASVTVAIPKGSATMADLDATVAERRFDELAVSLDGGVRFARSAIE